MLEESYVSNEALGDLNKSWTGQPTANTTDKSEECKSPNSTAKSSSDPSSVSIAVVGAGPAGLLFAIAAAQRGMNVLVFANCILNLLFFQVLLSQANSSNLRI